MSTSGRTALGCLSAGGLQDRMAGLQVSQWVQCAGLCSACVVLGSALTPATCKAVLDSIVRGRLQCRVLEPRHCTLLACGRLHLYCSLSEVWVANSPMPEDGCSDMSRTGRKACRLAKWLAVRARVWHLQYQEWRLNRSQGSDAQLAACLRAVELPTGWCC